MIKKLAEIFSGCESLLNEDISTHSCSRQAISSSEILPFPRTISGYSDGPKPTLKAPQIT